MAYRDGARTDGVARHVGRAEIDLRYEHKHDDEDDGGVEVGHVEGRSKPADERVRSDDERDETRGERHVQTLHEVRHHRRATWRSNAQAQHRTRALF